MESSIYDLTDNELSYYLAEILGYDPKLTCGVCKIGNIKFNPIQNWDQMKDIIFGYIKSIERDFNENVWVVKALDYAETQVEYEHKNLSKACVLAVVGSNCSNDRIYNHRPNVARLITM